MLKNRTHSPAGIYLLVSFGLGGGGGGNREQEKNNIKDKEKMLQIKGKLKINQVNTGTVSIYK